MKILILATDIFTRGGIARYTSTLASSLGGMFGRENVDVLCFFDWGQAEDAPRDFQIKGLVSSGARASTWSRLRYLWEVVRAGMKGCDLVIANHVALAPVAGMMKLMFGTPYWVACHCVEVWWGTSPWRRAALRNADMIVPVSLYTAEVVRKIEGVQSSRVKVVYNAIPNSLVKLLTAEGLGDGVAAKQPGGKVLLSVCSLARGNEFKGVDTVIRALPAILKVAPEARYVVAGEGEIRKNLESLAAEIGVKESVTFAGSVSDAELAELYRGCDVFVLPSRGQEGPGSVGGEGFGRVYIEAALAGKPVVGSRSGGASEAVIHARTGFVVTPDSIDAVAEAVCILLREPELAARMGQEGRMWALDKFSEEALAGSLSKLLRPYGFKKENVQVLPQAGGGL